MLKSFDLVKPRNLQEALTLKADGSFTPVAGGTDLLVKMKKGLINPDKIMDLSCIDELKEIKEKNDGIVLGSLVTHGDVVASKLAQEYLPLLVQGCRTVGSVQIRNKGTLGGNIMTASPAADSIPPLVALGAKVVLSSASGSREMALEEFIVGPGKTLLRPDELLTEIVVQKMKPEERCRYRKLGQRRALAISIASVAVRLEFNRESNKASNVRIAFGAVSPVIKRAKELEEVISQSELNAVTIKEISLKAREACMPITDIRASSEYRKDMCSSLLYETLLDMCC